jgi:hypothetical protein
LNADRWKDPADVPGFFAGSVGETRQSSILGRRLPLESPGNRESTAQIRSLAAIGRLRRNIERHRRNNEFNLNYAF